MTLKEAEIQIISKRYSIDIIPEVGFIEVEKIEKKKVVKVREKVIIIAVNISQENEILYLIEWNQKRMYKSKKEVKK